MSLISWLVSVAGNCWGQREAARRSLWVSDVGRVMDVCGWTNVAGSWCWSTSRLVYTKLANGRGNRLLKLARALALCSRANERENWQLKLTQALALHSRVCCPAICFDKSIKTIRDTPIHRRRPLMVHKRTFLHIYVVEKANATTRSGTRLEW